MTSLKKSHRLFTIFVNHNVIILTTMAWSYKKRIKVAPGVHLNISKSGVSTSMGTKGMSITSGPKGTYLNTSIPGTGLYNRQKITPASNSSRDTCSGIPDTGQTKIIHDGGNGCLTMILLLMFWVLLGGAGYYAYNTYYQGDYLVETEEEMSPNESIRTTDIAENEDSRFRQIIKDPWVFGLTALAIVCLIAGVIIDRKGKKNLKLSEKDGSMASQHSSTQNRDGQSYSEDEFRKIIDENSFDPLKQKILKSMLAQALMQDANSRVLPLIEKYQIKVERSDEEKNKTLLLRYEDEYNRIKREASELTYNVDSELTPEEGGAFNRFSSWFETFLVKTGFKKWRVYSISEDENNHEICHHMFREDTKFSIEQLNGLPSRFKIPCLQYSDTGKFYIYPRFLIDVQSNSIDKLFVYPLSKVSINYNTIFFLEDEDPTAAAGAKIVASKYLHSTKNGERDYRFSYNPSKPIVEYHPFTISLQISSTTLDYTFLVNTDDGSWGDYYTKLKEAYTKVNKPSKRVDINDASTGGIKPKKVVSDAISSAEDQLNALIGLTSVKEEIKALASFVKVQKMRENKGMKTSPISYHCVFTGSPGTGKTTVARIVSEIYKELGILKKGHLVETDRSGLVAEYVGQTAVKTNKIIDSALDGVLFIDEAYSLVDGGNSDYGKEAISTLLKRMEDDRDRLVVILAGYTEDMKRFIDSNPGLQSRFNRYIEFPDYSVDELYQIFNLTANKYEYHLTKDASDILYSTLQNVVANKDKNFGNGRYIRNLFEKIIEQQAKRLSIITNVNKSSLAVIEAEDIKSVI